MVGIISGVSRSGSVDTNTSGIKVFLAQCTSAGCVPSTRYIRVPPPTQIMPIQPSNTYERGRTSGLFGQRSDYIRITSNITTIQSQLNVLSNKIDNLSNRQPQQPIQGIPGRTGQQGPPGQNATINMNELRIIIREEIQRLSPPVPPNPTNTVPPKIYWDIVPYSKP